MKIGDEVVCIDDDFQPLSPRLNFYTGPHPVKDKIYIIEDIEIQQGKTLLCFPGFEMCYHKEGFRPLHYDFADEVIKNLIEEPINA